MEGYNLFLEMMASIRRNVIYSVYVCQVEKSLGVAKMGSGHMHRPGDCWPGSACVRPRWYAAAHPCDQQAFSFVPLFSRAPIAKLSASI